jgi:superfamily II DNA or RNA helicase
MSFFRERNNAASNRSYYKTKYQQLAEPFETFAIHKLNLMNHLNSKWYNWKNVPIQWLYDSGYIHNYYENRILRQNRFNEGDKNPLKDVGVDGIGKTENEEFILQQSKLYTNKITYDDINSWLFKVQISKKKNPRNNGLLTTINGCTDRLERDMNELELQRIQFTEKEFEEWHKNIKKDEIIDESNMVRKDYQIEDLNKIISHFSQHQTAKIMLNWSCGLGKTVMIADTIKHILPKVVIIIAPEKTEVQNLYERVPIIVKHNYNIILFDSDSSEELTTENLLNNIKTEDNKNTMIFTTFKTANEKIAPLLLTDTNQNEPEININEDFFEEEDIDKEDINKEFFVQSKDQRINMLQNALYIIDEAHEIKINSPLLILVNTVNKILFATATMPKAFSKLVNLTLILNERDFNFALSNKYIVDYQIKCAMERLPSESMEDIYKLANSKDEIIDKASFLMKGMLQNGSRRCIVYLSTKADCKEFSRLWCVVNQYYGVVCKSYTINDEIRHNERKRIIKEFQSGEDDVLQIIASPHCLDQAVDIPRCDSTFICCSAGVNEITLFQRFQRASRKDLLNINKINTCYLWPKDNKIEHLQDVLRKLYFNTRDKSFSSKVKMINQTYDNQNNIEVIAELDNQNIELDTKVREWVDLNLLYSLRKEAYLEYAKSNDQCPKSTDTFLYKRHIFNIGSDFFSMKKGINCELKNYLCKNNRWKIWFEEVKDREEEWHLKLNKVVEYINNNLKLPRCSIAKEGEKKTKDNMTSEEKEEYEFGKWISRIQQGYKNKNKGMNDNTDEGKSRRKIFEEKLMHLLDIEWHSKLNRVINYINNNSKIPRKTICEEGKQKIKDNMTSEEKEEDDLGRWISHIQQGYKNKNQGMNDDTDEGKIRRKEFEEKLIPLLENREDEWYLRLNKVIEYINNNSKIPRSAIREEGKSKLKDNMTSEEKEEYELGRWISQVKQGYKNKKHGMNDDTDEGKARRKAFEEKLIPLLENREDKWYLRLNKVIEYINNNSKIPRSAICEEGKSKLKDNMTSEEKEEYELGQWISQVKQGYKNKKEGMNDDTDEGKSRRKEFEEKLMPLLENLKIKLKNKE